MNKRIEELAIEAKLISLEPNGFDQTNLSKAQKKFAELIVQECAYIALREEHDPYECIKKHFGVK